MEECLTKNAEFISASIMTENNTQPICVCLVVFYVWPSHFEVYLRSDMSQGALIMTYSWSLYTENPMRLSYFL